jgi:hypothetical protein
VYEQQNAAAAKMQVNEKPLAALPSGTTRHRRHASATQGPIPPPPPPVLACQALARGHQARKQHRRMSAERLKPARPRSPEVRKADPQKPHSCWSGHQPPDSPPPLVANRHLAGPATVGWT